MRSNFSAKFFYYFQISRELKHSATPLMTCHRHTASYSTMRAKCSMDRGLKRRSMSAKILFCSRPAFGISWWSSHSDIKSDCEVQCLIAEFSFQILSFYEYPIELGFSFLSPAPRPPSCLRSPGTIIAKNHASISTWCKTMVSV